MSARVLWTLVTIASVVWSTCVTAQSTARDPGDKCGAEPLELRLADSLDRLREQMTRQEASIRSLDQLREQMARQEATNCSLDLLREQMARQEASIRSLDRLIEQMAQQEATNCSLDRLREQMAQQEATIRSLQCPQESRSPSDVCVAITSRRRQWVIADTRMGY